MSVKATTIVQTLALMTLGGFLTLTAFLGPTPGWMQSMWWVFLIMGVSIIVISLVEFGFAATHPTKIPCPYCTQRIVPKVRGFTGHLYLSRLDED